MKRKITNTMPVLASTKQILPQNICIYTIPVHPKQTQFPFPGFHKLRILLSPPHQITRSQRRQCTQPSRLSLSLSLSLFLYKHGFPDTPVQCNMLSCLGLSISHAQLIFREREKERGKEKIFLEKKKVTPVSNSPNLERQENRRVVVIYNIYQSMYLPWSLFSSLHLATKPPTQS